MQRTVSKIPHPTAAGRIEVLQFPSCYVDEVAPVQVSLCRPFRSICESCVQRRSCLVCFTLDHAYPMLSAAESVLDRTCFVWGPTCSSLGRACSICIVPASAWVVPASHWSTPDPDWVTPDPDRARSMSNRITSPSRRAVPAEAPWLQSVRIFRRYSQFG
jgi:hypothetical protein